jgi:steroid delta-isomerase
MLAQFAEDAELRFEGVPAGPFVGRDAIAAAYAENPPDDEIDVLDLDIDDDTATAEYGWRNERGRRAGRMILTLRGGKIQRLVVTFE